MNENEKKLLKLENKVKTTTERYNQLKEVFENNRDTDLGLHLDNMNDAEKSMHKAKIKYSKYILKMVEQAEHVRKINAHMHRDTLTPVIDARVAELLRVRPTPIR